MDINQPCILQYFLIRLSTEWNDQTWAKSLQFTSPTMPHLLGSRFPLAFASSTLDDGDIWWLLWLLHSCRWRRSSSGSGRGLGRLGFDRLGWEVGLGLFQVTHDLLLGCRLQETHSKVQCRTNIARSIFSTIFTIDIPYLAEDAKVWGAYYGFKIWSVCLHCCIQQHIILDSIIVAPDCIMKI